MSLFQNSVLNKYLKGLESEKVNQAYERFTNHFHNPTIQENIRNSKEEQYQGEFLIDLFVNVLGYTKNPTPNFNLTTELKNIKGSKKTDGAILKGEKALAVIELKGTNTTDLSKVETQAFGYKNNQPGCNYVITSNFEKLRFYIDNAVDFEEFNLFQLSKERFDILWLCLSSEYLLKDIPKKIKDESLTQEENVTKKLYKDYASFRNEIFDAIQKENPEYDKLTLFKKTQKLLDRFLFIFFAEDRLLLPPNSIRSIVNQWTDLRDKYDEYFPLYDRFKKYFGYMNTGHKGQQHDIFAYNGGLFAPDDILDNIKINDDLLHKHTINLSNYDFESEVSVNILGHIFEHSLNDIDEIQAEIQGVKTEQSKTKRKKDGVFYTPKYITKYIVDNTVGKLCEEKKIELDIQESEYEKERKGRQKATLKKLTQKLDDYRKWLLQITICDPACGSGAFLNQALEFLIAEHQYIDELQAKLFGDAMVLSEVENAILENNIYGVDINEESVEIAKLSLWLRTAQKGRKLTSLNNNIKCGNSLIDDTNVAGGKAFNWQNEFPEVFAKGGFDVIIGNPPYVFTRGNEHFQNFNDYIWTNYNHNSGKINLYSVFLELSTDKLLKANGFLGFITPETFIRTSTYGEIRRYLINQLLIQSISIYGIGVFDNVTAETITLIVRKRFDTQNIVNFYKHQSIQIFEKYSENQDGFNETPENRFLYGSSNLDRNIFKKMRKNNPLLGSFIDVRNGIATKSGKNNYISNQKLTENYKKLLEAPDLFRYGFIWPNAYINYDKEVLHRPRKEETFLSDKILIQRVSSRLICSFDDEKYYTFNSVNNLVLKEDNYNLKFLLGILNSRLIDHFYRRNYSLDASYTITVTKTNLDSIPVPKWKNSDIQQKIISNVDFIIKENKNIVQRSLSFQKLLKNKYSLEKLSKKVQSWYQYDFGTLLKELKKYKIQLSLKEEAEWMEYFTNEQAEIRALISEIENRDNEIDKNVYELYGLTEEEINIVEEATA
ncbi:Eco57I restriction-modification methylase domain-containing protein [Gelatiniphilus marinus]|uniref:site-specific DNA-methyltransferase (adenine-specific) n=1 Tax=Gelatiniphilus marinus TaxID=1759464 RepID=A0ABW5JVN8_9FLAO